MLTIVSMERNLLDALEQCRERERLSVRALAKRINVSDSYLSMVRSGSRKIGLPLLCGIAKAFPELDRALLAHLRNGHDQS